MKTAYLRDRGDLAWYVSRLSGVGGIHH